MKTIITVEIDHNQSLPTDVTDIIAKRVHQFLYYQGVDPRVTAKVWTHIALPVKEMGDGAA